MQSISRGTLGVARCTRSRIPSNITKQQHQNTQIPSCRIKNIDRRRYTSTLRSVQRYGSGNGKFLILGTCIAAPFLTFLLPYPRTELHAEAAPPPAEISIEKTNRKIGLSKEANRDYISSQHLQVRKSWENPGVYAFGSNSGRVAAPDSEDQVIKSPRRIPFFDGMLLRDIKLDRNFGAAITEKGDLLQWGIAYSTESREPRPTLTGKNLISITMSRDRILALGANGSVYSLPVSEADQMNGPKPNEKSWIPFWNGRSIISYRQLRPKKLKSGEKVTAVSSGLEHALLLSSNGRVFSAASCSEEYPSQGQLGVSGLTWEHRPAGPYDQPHEVTTLRGFDVAQIATGDSHSLVLDKEGRVFSFGDNSSGQLGFQPSQEMPFVDVPSLISTRSLYASSGLNPAITGIAAGGNNSYFTIEAVPTGKDAVNTRRVYADTWACGSGILGTLGNGRWTHVQATPTKIKVLSSLFEYDEVKNQVIPIRLKRLSVGATHASATMDNVTYVKAGERKQDTENDTNWGADVVWWGGNEFFQLGTGKRNNLAVPGYIQPLDDNAEVEVGRGKRKEEHRFQITPRHKVEVSGGRKVSMEQRVECGRFVSAVYSGT